MRKLFIPILLILMTVAVCYAVEDERHITQGDYGEEWPLTVSKVTLFCKHSMVWVETGDHVYPINGMAMSRLKRERPGLSVRDLEEIWRIDPGWEEFEKALKRHDPSYEIGSQSPQRVSVHDLIQVGLSMCN